MPSYGGSRRDQIHHNTALEEYANVIDLRSDSFSQPSLAMRQAMFNAEVGVVVNEESPIAIELQDKAAALLNKEAALFVASGTMGNLIASNIMNHCDVRGSEAYCGEESHTFLHGHGGACQLPGVTFRTLPNNPDGTYDLNILEEKLKSNRLHGPISKLILIENTFNGRILPQSWISEVSMIAKKHNLKLHMDGARLWNAAIGSGTPVKDIVQECDSVTFCLSKGLGAPVGSMFCGSKSFIEQASRVRSVLGGNMRQIGILAAAGLVAIKESVSLLDEDHRRALKIAGSINSLGSDVFSVDLNTTKTNIVLVDINSEEITASDFSKRLEAVEDIEAEDRTIVRYFTLNSRLTGFVLYSYIDDDAVEKVIEKIAFVIRKLDINCKMRKSSVTNE